MTAPIGCRASVLLVTSRATPRSLEGRNKVLPSRNNLVLIFEQLLLYLPVHPRLAGRRCGWLIRITCPEILAGRAVVLVNSGHDPVIFRSLNSN